MKKRFFAALLSFIMIFSLLPMNALAASDDSGFVVKIKQELANNRRNPSNPSDYSTEEDGISVDILNGIKVHLEDTDCNPLKLSSGYPETLEFTNNTMSPKDIADKMVNYIPKGYYYTGAYFYDKGNPSKDDIANGNIDYSDYVPNAVSKFTNHGEIAKKNKYDSYIGYASEKRQPDDWKNDSMDAAYNPTGVLHLVYAKIDNDVTDDVQNVWVNVNCKTYSYHTARYTLIDGSFTLSAITGSGADRTRTMAIDLSKYVAKFNSEEYAGHTKTSPADDTATITLKYDSTKKAWVPKDKETVPVKVEVECEKPKVTVTFDAKGGEWKTTPDGYVAGTCSELSSQHNTASKQMEQGFKLNGLRIAEPTRAGYKFNGWHQYSNCTDDPIKDFSKLADYLKGNEDIILYAGWDEDSQSSTNVSYYVYKHCYFGSEKDPRYNEEINIPRIASADTPIASLITVSDKADMVANGITYHYDSSKTKVNDDLLNNQTLQGGEIIHLYYYADTANYTIHHYLDGAAIPTKVADDETGTMLVGQTLTANDVTESKLYSDYKNVKAVRCEPSRSITIAAGDENNVITIYYSEPAPEYTYTLNYISSVSDSSVSNMPDPSFVTETTTEKSYVFTVSDTVPMRKGYTFKGWKDGAGNSYAADDQITLTAPDNTEATLYAQWVKQVDFDLDDIDGDGNGKTAVKKNLTVNGNGFLGETFNVQVSDGVNNTLTGSIEYAATDRGEKNFTNWKIDQQAVNENYVFNDNGTITFKESGEYTFTVSEVVDAPASGMSYDTSRHDLVVTVAEENDELVVTNVKAVTIGNTYDGTYTVELGQYIKKVYKSECGCAPETTFKFEAVFDQPEINSMPNETAVQSGVNSRTVNGEVTLKAGTKKTADMSVDLPAGWYNVVLKEVNDKVANVRYDETVYTFRIHVLVGGNIEFGSIDKNGEYYDFEKADYRFVFTNSYKDSHYIPVIPNPTPSKPALNTDDHYAYVVGYPDGTVHPSGYITRAEASTIFFRLLTDATREQYWSTTNTYSDVAAGDWYNNAISTLSSAGIVSGYPDGTFRPNAPITRAEMAKIIAIFAKLDKTENRFTDIAGHWAEAYIKLAAGNGWIEGYPDGTFKPQQNITRAETVTMINRVLDRVPSEESHLLPYSVMLTFPDCQPGQWFYIAIQEATNSHTYERAVTEKNGDEQWTALRDNRDWTLLEK